MNNAITILQLLLRFLRYFIGYICVIIISRYNLIYSVDKKEESIGLVLAILLTLGLVIKTLVYSYNNFESEEIKLINKLKNNNK